MALLRFSQVSVFRGFSQKGVDVLTRYYGVRRMKIAVDGRRVGNGYEAEYFENFALFTKKGLNKRNVLHELYHHIVENRKLDMTEKKKEREAHRFVREVMKKPEKTSYMIHCQ